MGEWKPKEIKKKDNKKIKKEDSGYKVKKRSVEKSEKNNGFAMNIGNSKIENNEKENSNNTKKNKKRKIMKINNKDKWRKITWTKI